MEMLPIGTDANCVRYLLRQHAEELKRRVSRRTWRRFVVKCGGLDMYTVDALVCAKLRKLDERETASEYREVREMRLTAMGL